MVFLTRPLPSSAASSNDRYPELDKRGFDFSLDYEVINELGQAYYERAKMERGHPEQQKQFAQPRRRSLPENACARFGKLDRPLHARLDLRPIGDQAKAAYHRQEHEKYLPDYNAQDRAISIARRADPAADHAAQATVIYPLHALTNL